jgi:hypothetical protein
VGHTHLGPRGRNARDVGLLRLQQRRQAGGYFEDPLVSLVEVRFEDNSGGEGSAAGVGLTVNGSAVESFLGGIVEGENLTATVTFTPAEGSSYTVSATWSGSISGPGAHSFSTSVSLPTGDVYAFYGMAHATDSNLVDPEEEVSVGPVCGDDSDGDGVNDDEDNCPSAANSDQADLDEDGLGNVCDDDQDGDGVSNDADNCPFDVNSDQADTDHDGAGSACDDDVDGDGVLEAADACADTPSGEVVNADGCSVSQLCPCEHPAGGGTWKNHGAYVACVSHAGSDFVEAGLLTEEEKDALVSAAGQSSCGAKK